MLKLGLINPDAPCMEYVPTFGSFVESMLVNIPYMEHMGNPVLLGIAFINKL